MMVGLFIENSEGIWYVDKKGGSNADKYQENRASKKEKENQPGKKEKEGYVENVYTGFCHSSRQE